MDIMLTIPDMLNRRLHDLPAAEPETLGERILRLLEVGVAEAESDEAMRVHREWLDAKHKH